MILLIDNYDSFTYNLYQYLCELGAEVHVARNDQTSIEEIDGLERQKERLLARMEIIEQLQKSRPEIVHLFDEIARQLPEGVYLTGMTQRGTKVELRGVAQSSTRVSALMRQVDASAWMMDPEVDRVETTSKGASRQAEFIVHVKQEHAKDASEDLR